LHLAYNKLATNEEYIQQTLGLADVAKYMPCFRSSFACMNMYSLPINKIASNDEENLLGLSIIGLLNLRVSI